jgi:membrane-associated phospholipid phosphatase
VAAAVGFALVCVPITVLGEVPGDEAVLRAVRTSPGDGAHGFWRLVDRATDGVPQVLAATLLVGVLLVRRQVRSSLLAGAAFAAALGGNALLKRAWERPRPLLMAPVEDVSAFSFPAGHAAGPAALAVVLAVVSVAARRHRHVVVASVLVVATTGASQLALARHHPSDVVAGWLWGTAVAAAVWGWGSGRARQGSNLRPSA